MRHAVPWSTFPSWAFTHGPQAKKFERAIKRYGRALEPLESDHSFSSAEKDRAKVRLLRPASLRVEVQPRAETFEWQFLLATSLNRGGVDERLRRSSRCR